MKNQIQHEIKIQRTSKIIKLGHELYEKYAKKFVNKDVEILIEKNNKGHTRNYIDAYCEGNENEIVKARAVEYGDNGLECLRRN